MRNGREWTIVQCTVSRYYVRHDEGDIDVGERMRSRK